ncbi:MAG: nucleotidyltransferase family protein [Armatimonadota bacterium]|nr:nucleotidyltransferase family protein [Armatimonadota bacterium]MDR7533558.1 nucleotidyltransferase family protein [Armatimonadota bacterium]MDR7537358.1 nucleotidyltransferase family protein [Armatimonadota bacterium]
MKAFLLAAGLGTRLRPLTATVPKCLVPVRGVPLLRIWLTLCERHGITDVLVNLHYLADRVREYLAGYSLGVRVHLVYEPVLLGSAGTVRANQAFVRGEPYFFIFYADTLTNANLAAIGALHASRDRVLTMALARLPNPQSRGIAELDANGVIVSFVEKPAAPRSDLANAGIYVADPRIFAYIPEQPVADFAYDVLPRLVGKMNGYVITDYLLDIGTPADYAQAEREWEGL